jgi:hypothetical protein
MVQLRQEGVRVRLSKVFVLLALVGITASAAMADGVDPTVVIRQTDPAPILITSPTQTIGLFGQGTTANNGIVDIGIQNVSGFTLTSITVTLIGLNANLDFTAGTQDIESQFPFPFLNSSRTVNPNGSVTLAFFGLDDTHQGLLSGACNEETNTDNDFDADDCTGPIYEIEIAGIPLGDIVSGAATVSAPEPGTLMLLSAGLVGLAALRRRRAVL